MKYCFGVDIGGTTVKLGLFSEAGAIVEKWEIVTRTENEGAAILPDVAEAINGKLEQHGIEKEQVLGIGVGVPAPVTVDGIVNGSANLGWKYKNAKKELEELKEQGKDAALGSFTKFPDILMMDGGKGQVNVALRVLDHLGLDIPVCGMVKDDDHRTRGLYYNNEEIIFAPNSEAFLLVTRIQDEAHRFAIEYHRSLRAKGQVHSVLDDIKGVGPKRRKELMKYFKDLGQIKTATVTELLNVPGMNQSTAESIYGFFHDRQN